ncbi:MAG TPA: DUF1015 domain-containing protein [Planctomycetaceae bacterium]|nr:DUF1015 domain-containing protein [Planctomycetaceae bacterium]
MAQVLPLRGWRYDIAQVGSLSDVTAPPYDVIGPDQQKALYERHPCNVVRLILNRPEPGDADGDERYRRAANFLRHWRSEGILIREHEDALYVYHQEFDWEGRHYVRKGFLGRLRLEEFGRGAVYPHEQTMSGPKADRLALTRACRMNLSPVFGLYPDDEAAVQSPLEAAVQGLTPLEARDELGVVHRMWPVTEASAVNQVREALRERPIFIADGHHRYETAINYRNWLTSEGKLAGDEAPANFVLMHFVGMSDPGLAILPTHRLVSGVGEVTADDLRSALSANLELEAIGTGPHAARETWDLIVADGGQNVFGFGTTRDDRWQFARVTDASPMTRLSSGQSESWRALGVSLLHRLVLEHLVKAKFPDAAPDSQYVHQLDEVTSAMAGKTCQLACLVPPAGIGHVEDIASRFEKMPPKSTYFYPKLLSGLVFHGLE